MDFSKLKPGDTVIRDDGWNHRTISTVERLTPKYFFVDSFRFSRENGEVYGMGYTWRRPSIHEATEEAIKEIESLNIISKTYGIFNALSRGALKIDLSSDQCLRIVDILNESLDSPIDLK